ncbi:hypothetical protein [Leeuwenhoekiella marinoflava]|uniref:Beta-galactosidase-like protein n=2 Tax=Leeuwenhoekiella marinoflava TaxID=988 RepID=A0A4V1KRS1_9FLAO|nr:hypothetical protein [Leeuwenhoekiella marinoflava]RXG25892.1 hypothetical protein DSL99_3436 [Leeuwenhoekiella marinoflava]SHF99767.1 hypothetical protein SAMN02745246_03938 [Leeuwenhoekiella marinoflava DSM 3653]
MIHFCLKRILTLVLPTMVLIQSCTSQSQLSNEKTVFQTSRGWMPEIDIRADAAIVYGVDGNPSDPNGKSSFEQRVTSWSNEGYKVHFMTGIAWGSYQDYFLGEWDGINHLGEGQVQMNGDTIWHGRNVPYIVPTASFITYMKEQVVKRVIDNGVSSIYLEEPEFWARSGYSSAFKKAWKDFYKSPWQAQDKSPEATWLANKLKYQLYFDALDEVSTFAKEYGKSKGLDVKVYIPTHSLINYSSWAIVSPEASLASLPGIDGYIAQVWTGTSREPVFYNGIKKERTFENAFLEYGSMVSMTKPTGRKLLFLTDPIEDRRKTWEDYKQNYQATFIAQLLYPSVANFEVMPWPERIYTSLYQVAGSDERILIPNEYSTQMQIMINALNEIPVTKNAVSGSKGIDVILSNSLMFQRFPQHKGYDDPALSNFYGLALPLLKKGIPVGTVHLENLGNKASLEDTKVLIMSYSNLKPASAEDHKHLEEWVKNGGTLVYCSSDSDPFQTVKEWWNTDYNYKTPSAHLFELMEIDPKSGNQKYSHGKGSVYILKQDPKDFITNTGGDSQFLNVIKSAYTEQGEQWIEKNNFYLKRDEFDIVSVLEESVSDEPYTFDDPVIDLFDPELPVISSKKVAPGEQSLVINLNRVEKSKPQVLATAARVSNEEITKNSYRFSSRSPIKTVNAMRILLPKKPSIVELTDLNGTEHPFTEEWDQESGTLLLKFDNIGAPITTSIKW